MSSLWFIGFHLKAQQALKWWFQRQSMYLAQEAEKIREGLLQESFTMRRSLELSLVDNGEISTKKSQDWLKKVENFHHALKQLSERLSPAYSEDNLPLAIYYLVEQWQTANPRLKFQFNMPHDWRHEPPDHAVIILRVLDELFRLTVSELLTDTSIRVSLQQKGNRGELSVKIFYIDKTALFWASRLKEWEYLSQTFRFLTSGQCFWRRQGLTVVWLFHWTI